ncbi:MAG TPA: ribonucleoprotein [Pyrodictium sp.]|nr:ribonucleoprotein [Pyrodictium sp.]
MVLAPTASRRFWTEMHSLLDKQVKVVLVNGRMYEGKLLGFEQPSLDLVLADARTPEGDTIPRLIIRGANIAEIRAYEVSIFDANEFAEYIRRKLGLRPDAVKVYPDAGVVVVLNTYRVTASGVEGSGAMAGRIYALLKEYMEAKKRGEKPQ